MTLNVLYFCFSHVVFLVYTPMSCVCVCCGRTLTAVNSRIIDKDYCYNMLLGWLYLIPDTPHFDTDVFLTMLVRNGVITDKEARLLGEQRFLADEFNVKNHVRRLEGLHGSYNPRLTGLGLMPTPMRLAITAELLQVYAVTDTIQIVIDKVVNSPVVTSICATMRRCHGPESCDNSKRYNREVEKHKAQKDAAKQRRQEAPVLSVPHRPAVSLRLSETFASGKGDIQQAHAAVLKVATADAVAMHSAPAVSKEQQNLYWLLEILKSNPTSTSYALLTLRGRPIQSMTEITTGKPPGTIITHIASFLKGISRLKTKGDCHHTPSHCRNKQPGNWYFGCFVLGFVGLPSCWMLTIAHFAFCLLLHLQKNSLLKRQISWRF